jgi:hypothetical protein
MWNIFYNSLLNLTFTSGTKIIAFADDLLLLTRGKSVSEVENIANTELKKSQCGQKITRSVSTTKSQSNADDTSKKERYKGLGNIFKQQTPQRS